LRCSQITLGFIPIKKQTKHPSTNILLHRAAVTFYFRLPNRPYLSHIP